MNIVDHSLMIHPAVRVEFFVVVGIAIELGPYANHKAATHLVHAVEHQLGRRKAGSLKLMGAPLILHPVVPVLHDIVAGNLALAELAQRRQNLLLGLIALTTLPEAQHPLGIDGSLTCQRTIAADDLVGILAGNEVIVHVLRHLAPYRELLLVGVLLRHTQTTIADTTIGTPLDTQLGTTALSQRRIKLIGIRIPGSTPALGHHLLTIDIHLDIAGIVENEMVRSEG